ncbi:MAG: flagellar basal-body rod protein FlgF [Terriglobia bacterium]
MARWQAFPLEGFRFLAFHLQEQGRGKKKMYSGYYAAVTGLVAKFDALDLIANNLANVNTTGYKAQEEFYRTLTATMGNGNVSPLNRAVNDYGVLGGAATNFATGPIQATGNPLDIALEGKGFIVAKTSAGDRYTRDGSLHVNASGILSTSEGDPVMGLIPKPKGKPGEGPIKVPQGAISISPGGVISVNGSLAGQLKLVQFAPGTRLQTEGNGYFSAPAVDEQPAANPGVRQGSLESSNVNAMGEMVSLILLQRETQMLQTAISTFDHTFDDSMISSVPIVQ